MGSDPFIQRHLQTFDIKETGQTPFQKQSVELALSLFARVL